MAKKIKHSDLIASNVFKPATKNAEALLVVTKELTKAYKDLLKTSKKKIDGNLQKTSKDIKKFNEETKKATKTVKDLKQVQEAEVKIQKEVQKATKKTVEEKLKEQAANKAIKDSTKDMLIILDKNAGTLQKLAARNRRLRREREQLNLKTDEGRKRLEQINKRLDQNNKKIVDNSDKLKKQRLNVGNYTDSIKEAAGASGLFGNVINNITNVQQVFQTVLKAGTVQTEADTVAKTSNAGATKTLTIAQRGLNTATATGARALKLFRAALLSTGVGALVVALGGLVAFLTTTQRGIDKVNQVTAALSAGWEVLRDRASKIGEALSLFAQGDFADGFNKLKEAAEGFTIELKDEVIAATELEKQLQKVVRLENDLIAARATSRRQTAELKIISADVLRTTAERIEAAQKALEIEDKIADAQVQAQKLRFANILAINTSTAEGLNKVNARIQLIRDNIGQALGSGVDIATALEQGLIDIQEVGLGESTEEERKGALEAFAQIEQIREEGFKRQGKVIKQITGIRDADERKRLTVAGLNIQLISDLEEKALETELLRREKVLIEARRIGLNEAEIVAVSEKKIAEIRQKFADQRDKAREAELKKSEDAARKQAETINRIEQEQINQRVEIVSDARTRELDAAFKDGEELSEARINSLLDTIETEFELRKRAAEDNAEFALTNEKLTAEERELINLQLQGQLDKLESGRLDAIEDVNQKVLEREAATAAERNAEIKDALNQIADEFKEFFKKASEERIAVLDRELAATNNRMNQLRALAERGSEDATNNLANEIQRQAELEQARAQEIQNQKNLELGLTALKAFTANLEAGDGNALGNTIGQITALIGFISSISGSFKEGTEDTGTVSRALDKDGGRMAILHDNERVLTKEQNRKVGDLSNDELANLAYMHHSGRLETRARANEVIGAHAYQTNEQLLTAVENLEHAIKANKPAKENWYFDGRREMLIHEVKKAGKTERTHMKSTGLFS